MAIERIQLIPDEKIREEELKEKIITGEITKENYDNLSFKEKDVVKDVLFEMASENINLYAGVATMEYIMMGSLRVMQKQINNEPLNETDFYIKDTIDRIMSEHEVSRKDISRKSWMLDYMKYAEENAMKILENRKEYLSKKQSIINHDN